jgi:glycosyltransferase involved in cell wall biosynthesis
VERRARRARPDLVLANSRWTQSHLPSLLPGVPSEVVYPPVTDRTPADRAAVRQAVRAELGTAGDAVVIVQASRLEAWKGHEVLLRALARLADLPGWECWIAGGAQRPEEEQYLTGLRDQAGRSGLAARVRFLGQRADVPQLLAAADIHCQPNAGPEPFGIAFVEALYAGLPVVTAAHGGALEVVDPTCGILLPPGDDGALATELRRLVRDADARRALGAAGPDRARRLCDPGDRLRQLAQCLAPCAGRGAVA